MPPQPPKKQLIWPWIVIGGVLLFCGGCFGLVSVAGNDSQSAASTTTRRAAAIAPAEPVDSPAPKPGKSIAPAGSAVRDGQFEFQVTAIDPPKSSVGSGFMQEKARGEFIVIHVDITNTGRAPRSYFDDNQKLFDDQGREYANNSMAGLSLGEDTYTTDLNPGFKISVAIVFDVPPGTVPATLELHDSMFSGGVKVALK
ncbi:DUF4352 domain-containing protein [Nocardia sp. R7R-8]|uniref:DUF4352 domain-containing protein n=1 Tax=Nocardia sp. R7R-8 TaxID=3459304 RepID=UPI00403D93D2